jgi:alpha-N-arabinofuranosidase
MNRTVDIFSPLRLFCLISMVALAARVSGQTPGLDKTAISVSLDSMAGVIDANLYGQFSEHLGSCIYGGLWVGEGSPIPNTRGIRNDVVAALRKLKVPVLRWPGGCFADEYHWMDGIGPRNARAKMVNTNWGGVVEDNSFGTHEFLDLCGMIGAEPYISGNLGRGTVDELAKWIEYTTSDGDNPMANLRRKHGRHEPWTIKYWGVGNESWGCGGRMRPEYYADLARQYSTFMKNYGANQVYKIASGPNGADTVWTKVVMERAGQLIDGIGLHYYTNAAAKPASVFDERGWFDIIKKTLYMDELLALHTLILDRYDPGKKVALIVDEWGTWYAVEPGTNPAFLYQQNTLRDAIVAASNLNIFHHHCDRVKMTNIAQMVNVLQSMILTDKEKMVLTPTYHVFEMYNVHQNAIHLPLSLKTGNYTYQGDSVPSVNASASMDAKGIVHISLCNVHPQKAEKITIDIKNFDSQKVTARLLTASAMNALNSFDKPNQVAPVAFSDFTVRKDKLELNMPAKSVIVFELQGKLNSKIGAPVKVDNPKPKLNYEYYETVLLTLPDFSKLSVLRQGLIDQIAMPADNSGSDFAVRYSGYLKIPADGFYNFFANGDDGVKLYVDDKLIINNDGRHAPIEKKGFASLQKGFHKIVVEFFQAGGGAELNISIEGTELKKQTIPADMLFHESK